MKVPFVDLRAQHEGLRSEIEAATAAVIERGDFILGEAVERFEAEYAEYLGVAHAVGAGNGLDALSLALRAHDIGPGDEVIAPANTFIATVLAIMATGARPSLVDVDPETYNITAAAVAAAVGPRTRAVMPVHLFGQPCDMAGIMAEAVRHNLLVIEDAAQAHGARYKGRRAGSIGDAAGFSFYPSKNLGACGDGGIAVTNDAQVARKMRLLGNYGQREKYYHAIAGVNTRLDTIQAAVLRIKLRRLDDWNAARRAHAAVYDSLLRGIVRTPAVSPDVEHIYHLYVIETDVRDTLRQVLQENGVASGIHYPVPVHLQDACAGLGYRHGDFPVTEAAAARMLSLPMFAELTTAQIQHVSEVLARTVGAAV